MRNIVQDGDPVLREHAQDIPVADIPREETQALIRELQDIVRNEPLGVAIAAPQIGASVRLFVISGAALLDPAAAEKKPTTNLPPDLVFINPEVIRVSRKKKEMHEGCLSVRGWWGVVPRAEKIEVRAYNENGTPFSRGASGLLAQIIQHEMDHLDGVLYTDKAVVVYKEKDDEEHISPLHS